MITKLKLVIGKIEAWFAVLFALEAWTAGMPFKKRREGLAQIEKRLIRGVLGDFPRPGELLTPDLVELLLEREGCWFSPGFIVPVPLGKRPVPHEAGSASSFGKIDCLLMCWMQAYLVGFDHVG